MKFMDIMSRNFLKPDKGFYGTLARLFLNQMRPMQRIAVEQLQIKPHENVLEIGFGFGYGLKYTLDTVLRNGSGKLYGVDHSEAACDYVKNWLENDISTGKLTLLSEDIANVSLNDIKFDKVFHTNVYVYWPDLVGSCSEIKKIMNPGGNMLMMIGPARLGLYQKLRVVRCARPVTPDTYAEAAEEAGFTDVKMEVCKRGPFTDDLLSVWCTKPNIQEV